MASRFVDILFRLLFGFYRYGVSPVLAAFGVRGACRFTPTCSEYAREALREHGPWRGSWLALRRIGRCHPWGKSGFDPVPKKIVNSKKKF